MTEGLRHTPAGPWPPRSGSRDGLAVLWNQRRPDLCEQMLQKGCLDWRITDVSFLHGMERPEQLWSLLAKNVDLMALGRESVRDDLPQEALWHRLARRPSFGDPNKGLCEQVRAWASATVPEDLERLVREEYFQDIAKQGKIASGDPRTTEAVGLDMCQALRTRSDWKTLQNEQGEPAFWFAVTRNAQVLTALPSEEVDWNQCANGQDLWFALIQSPTFSMGKAARLALHRSPQPTPEGNGWWCERPEWLDHVPLAKDDPFLTEHARLVIQGTPAAQEALADHLWGRAYSSFNNPLITHLPALCRGWAQHGLPPLHPHLQAFLIAWVASAENETLPALGTFMPHRGALPLPPVGQGWDGASVSPDSLWSPSNPAHERVVSALRSWNTQALAPVQPHARRRLRS